MTPRITPAQAMEALSAFGTAQYAAGIAREAGKTKPHGCELDQAFKAFAIVRQFIEERGE